MLAKPPVSLSSHLVLAGLLWIGLTVWAPAARPPPKPPGRPPAPLAPAGTNLMAAANDTDNTPLVDNPWGGVINGVLTVPSGSQLAVTEAGNVALTAFGPSLAVGDLNGDGLPDLVVADAIGYFWYFPNSGTPTQPKFTAGEVMPIWIGDPVVESDDGKLVKASANYDSMTNTVPRIQLVDYTGEKKLSIVAGNFAGKLFYIHNVGTSKRPAFVMPQNLDTITQATYTDGKLWCNYLAPFLYDFTGNGHLDLVMGEGTYASNSIYRLVNKGNNGSPIFSEKFTTKIIVGYGREHLNPQVVDWNNDGKPDIITGERLGFIDLYLNDSPDNVPAHLHFDNPVPPLPPNHVLFGGRDQLGSLTTVAVGDLTHNNLPNLVISNSQERILYALNKGKLGAPEFGAPQPIPGVNPFPKIFEAPKNWTLFKTFDMPYVQMVSTNRQVDPTFTPPPGMPTVKSALKVYTVPHTHAYFPVETFPVQDTHFMNLAGNVRLQAGVHYDFSFWSKISGQVTNPRYFFSGEENLYNQGITLPNGLQLRTITINNSIATSSDSSWVQTTGDVYFDKAVPDKDDVAGLGFHIAFNGKGGSITVTGFSLTQSQDK